MSEYEYEAEECIIEGIECLLLKLPKGKNKNLARPYRSDDLYIVITKEGWCGQLDQITNIYRLIEYGDMPENNQWDCLVPFVEKIAHQWLIGHFRKQLEEEDYDNRFTSIAEEL